MLFLTASDVADYFLTLVDEEAGDNISNLKLQKLLYYAQGFHLALYDSPLFLEKIKAWEHGPVVPSVWGMYKEYGADALPAPKNVKFSKFSIRRQKAHGRISKGSRVPRPVPGP